MKSKAIYILFAVLGMLSLGLFALGPALPHEDQQNQESPYQVFAVNDLGMHCYDSDFSIFAVLPPFNVIHSQVVLKGFTPQILDDSQVRLDYRARPDSLGSINTTSMEKTNFWTYASQLFGASLAPDEGLLGAKMPGPNNRARPFAGYDPIMKWFSAAGIPITTWDDSLQKNPYPLMRIRAFTTASTTPVSYADAVVPVSDEISCSECHHTGSDAADSIITSKYGITDPWSTDPDEAIQTKRNILILHDAINSTTLQTSTPVLCASCHYSPALDLNNLGPQGDQVGKSFLSHAIHTHHGMSRTGTVPDANNPAIIEGTTRKACYACHPGNVTQCLRGAMFGARLHCQNCHGDMLAVAGYYDLGTGGKRMPWVDMPKCQSCHTGDALNQKGEKIILRSAYSTNDPAATPRIATNKRFAENDGKLFRFSSGHGGIACLSCHGSPHAEWPVTPAGAVDNREARQIQGYTGPITECNVCHEDPQRLLPLGLNGPHGMHNVYDDRWNLGHFDIALRSASDCRACHGMNGEGTVLSRTAVKRTLIDPNFNPVDAPRGKPIACTLCHPVSPL